MKLSTSFSDFSKHVWRIKGNVYIVKDLRNTIMKKYTIDYMFLESWFE